MQQRAGACGAKDSALNAFKQKKKFMFKTVKICGAHDFKQAQVLPDP